MLMKSVDENRNDEDHRREGGQMQLGQPLHHRLAKRKRQQYQKHHEDQQRKSDHDRHVNRYPCDTVEVIENLLVVAPVCPT